MFKFNFNNKEDKGFFFGTSLIGLIPSLGEMSEAGFIPNEFLIAIIKAGLIAFISGFLGVFGKRVFEYLYKKIFKRNEKTDK